jgi:hypothetical protein
LKIFIHIIPGVFFSDGPFWIEQRRFALQHLRDLGFGRRIMVASICEEVEDVIKELRQHEEFEVIALCNSF